MMDDFRYYERADTYCYAIYSYYQHYFHRFPHSGAVFLFPKLTDREKIRKFFQGLKST